MNRDAIGIIETIGMAAAIEAADTAVKSANVKLIGYELSKGQGMVTVKISGNVGAVKVAINAAKISAESVNRVAATLLIPRPAENLNMIIESKDTIGLENKQEFYINSNNYEKEIKAEKDEKMQSYEESIDNSLKELNHKEDIENNKNICNLCFDEKCPRRKGQSKIICIHYNEKQGE